VGADRGVVARGAVSPVGVPPAAGTGSRRDERDSVGVAHGDAVERAQRDRAVLVVFGTPTVSGVGEGRGVL